MFLVEEPPTCFYLWGVFVYRHLLVYSSSLRRSVQLQIFIEKYFDYLEKAFVFIKLFCIFMSQ